MLFDTFSDYKGCEPMGAALPRIEIDQKYYEQLGAPNSISNIEFLKKLARKKILEKGIDKRKDKKRYYDQAKYEIEVFEETGLQDYILALWDIVNFANENGIKTSPGRGSAASSLILYLIDVTKIDPIKYDLIFERFVSKTRIKKVGEENGVTYFDGSLLADVDLDFDYSRRQEVIKYIEEKYRGRTAKILTFNTFSSKLCIKEAVKFFENASEEESGVVSDLIQKKHGVVSSLAESLEDNEKFQDWAHDHENTITQARKVEDLKKNSGVHPSGIGVSFAEIDSICPLQSTKDGDLITGYEMNDVADLMVKFDILGLRTITIANLACQKAGINIDDIDPEDPFIYEILQSFKFPCGLFQVSAETNFRVAQEVKPVNLGELADVVSLSRPGALALVGEYIKQKENPKKMGLNDTLDNILAKTKNVLIFQEQSMSAISDVFGMSKEDAESARKAIGKKLREEIPKWKGKIYEAAEKNNVDKRAAEYFWKILEASANYSFNKCIFEEELVEIESGVSTEHIPLKDVKKGMRVKTFDTENSCDRFFKVKNVFKNKVKCYEVSIGDKTIACSEDHKFLIYQRGQFKMVALKNFSVIPNSVEVVTWNRKPEFFKNIKYVGVKKTIDLEIDSADHNFYCNGIVVSNSHAYSYGDLAARTILIKHRHPKEFFCAILDTAQYEPDPRQTIAEVSKEVADFGIRILPPNLERSSMDFTIENNDIRYGLSSIKGISQNTFKSLETFAQINPKNKYEVFLAAKESGINIGVLSSLIYAGSLGEQRRSRTVLEAQAFNLLTDREKRNFCLLGPKYNYDLLESISEASSKKIVADDGKPIFKDSRFETFKKKFEPFKQLYLENKKHEKLSIWWFEKQLLGYSFSLKLKECFQEKYELNDFQEVESEFLNSWRAVCIVDDFFVKTSKNGNRYMMLTVSDDYATKRVMLCDSKKEMKLTNFEQDHKLKKGEILVVKASRGNGGGSDFAEAIKVISDKVFTNVRDLK